MTTKSTAANKQPTLRREPLIPDLVIQDLRDMDMTGNYDRNVLLWVQDGYVHRALQEHLVEIRELHEQLVASGRPADEVRREKMIALVGFVRETYSTEKAGGRGADLKGYVEAARIVWETEAARYGEHLQELGDHLQELGEYLKKALANGEKPNLDWLARNAYVSMARMSSVIGNLESLVGKPAAQEAARMMQRGIDAIHVEQVGGRSTEVGRALMAHVVEIAKAPNKYIQSRDPSKTIMPKREPFDFEPAHRAEHGMGMTH
ncbi:MAG: hypothetical protein WC617_12855 [Rhodanobacter sp.]|jgi:hypothetical protein